MNSTTTAKLPDYYSALAGFEKLFQEGIPILNYHMIAPLPPDQQLKGLYAPPRVLARQLRELSAAGFSSGSLDAIPMATDNADHRVVIAFDDGYASVFENAIGSLAEQRFRAIQFLVPTLIGKTNEWDLVPGIKQLRLMDTAQIAGWLKAGHAIGSHTLTHPYLTRIPPARAREEIGASKKWLEDRFGVAVEHFCYPYGDWNPSVRDEVIQAGYRTACTVRFGVNTRVTDPFTLRRIKGRHPTRKLRSLLRWLGIRP